VPAMRKVSLTIYPTPEQLERLKALSERTGVPFSRYVRDGIDLVLALRSEPEPLWMVALRERGRKPGFPTRA
jgi:ribbon-helix-helix protein